MHRTDQTTTPSPALGDLARAVAGPLEQVRCLLDRHTRDDDPQFQQLADHLAAYRGKMLRPVMLLLAARVFGEPNARHVTYAAAIELLHMATLIHDDVLDEAAVRRGRPAVSRLWGNEASVLLGDYLLSQAFELCGRGEDLDAIRATATASAQMCRGELAQCLRRSRWDMTEPEYFQIIELKTASLYRLCGYLGGRLAGAGEADTAALADFGWTIGVAFQIADDLLDLVGSEQQTGKTLGRDLAQGKPTLPIIHALAVAGPADQARLQELLGASAGDNGSGNTLSAKGILVLLERTGSIQYAQDRARRLGAEARGRLDRLDQGPAREALERLADFVVERSW